MRNVFIVILSGLVLASCGLADSLFHPTDLGQLVHNSWGEVTMENTACDPNFFLVGTNQMVRLSCKTISADPVLEVRVDLTAIGAGSMKLNPDYSRTEWSGVSFILPPTLGIKDIKFIALNSKGIQVTNVLTVTISTNEKIIYVSPAGNDANLGTLKGAPLLTLGKAVDKSHQTGIKVVYVSGGIYDQVYSGFHVNLLLQNVTNLSFYGGWNDGFTVRNINLYPSIIDRIHNPNTGVAVIDSEGILLDGITIRGIDLSDDVVSLFSARGGGITVARSTLVLRDVKLIANEALSGGGIFCNQSALWLTNVSFISNDALIGAGMYIFQSDPQIAGCEFIANKNGGGLFVTNESNPYITNCLFRNNGNGKPGGAIHYTGSLVSLYGNTFEYNMGGVSGGAIYLSKCSNGVFYGNTFNNNSAGNAGGAIAFRNCPSDYELFNNTFSGNQAFFGGAICSTNTSKITFFQDVFTQNRTSTDNGIQHFGGAIALYYTPYEIGGCTFTGNEVQFLYGYGGAIAALNSAGKIVNSAFSNNTAYYSGGALMFMNSSALIISNIFDYNRVWYSSGGALFANTCQLTMKWNQWISNYAYGLGGAFYFYSCVATNKNDVFFRCWSQGSHNSLITLDGSSAWKLGYTFISNLFVLGSYPSSLNTAFYNTGGLYTNTFVANVFSTNSLNYFYIKAGGRYITNNSDWVNINNPTAMISYPNSTNNKSTNL